MEVSRSHKTSSFTLAMQTYISCTCMYVYYYVSAVTSGKREMTIVDCAMITDAVKWNERVLRLQTLGLLK